MHDEPIALLCAACERPMRAGARFCPSCGQTYTAPPPGEPVPSGPALERSTRPSLGAVVVAQWSELTRIGWLYGLLLLSSLIFAWIARLSPSPWTGVALAGFDAVLIVGYVVARPTEVLELLRLPRTTVRGALQMIGAACACTAVLVGYFAVFETAGLPMLQLTEEYTEAGWPAWSMFVLISAMPALFEELAFRGVIHCTLERVLSAREAQIIQAALFSIVHLSPVIFLSHFLMGFYFGWLRNQTRSLYPSMLAHASWNAYWVADELWWT